MKVLGYIASLLFLYLMAQAWGFLWDIHFLLPIGIIVTMLAIGMALLVTAVVLVVCCIPIVCVVG